MRLLLLTIILCLSFSSAQAQNTRRVALVIGNQDYVVGPARLARPHDDARLVHEALVSAGFDAGEAPLFDLDKAEFETALRDFARQARHAEAAVVYYAGHAIHALNETWLIPVGARLELQDDIRTEGIRLSDVVAIARRDGLSIVFLDACRDNPFASYRGGGGLPATPPPEGSVVAYAAAAGHPAPDDGAYARALATRMQEEGVELRQLLNRVAEDVRRARNAPAELAPVAEIQLANTNQFYFRGAPATSPSVSTSSLGDQAFGVAVRQGTRAAYEAYLTRYPEGALAQLARMMLPPSAAAAETWPPRQGQAPCPEIRAFFFFNWDRTELSPEAMATVDLVAERWRQCGPGRASIFANFTLNSDEHEDVDPGALTTAALYVRFIRRVASVRDAFASRGVPADYIAQLGVKDPDVVVFERDPQQRYVEITVRFD